MTEVENELLNRMTRLFDERMKKSTKVTAFMRKADKGQADYSDAWNYADEVGTIASKTAQEFADEIYSIADGYEPVVEYLIDNGYAYASEYTLTVQEMLNKKYGINIQALVPEVDMSRVSGIAHIVSNAASIEETARNLGEPVINYVGSVVSDTLKKNVDFQREAGLTPTIIRTSTGKCCEWCDNLAGKYEGYAPNEVYQRHERCRCTVLYDGKRLKAHRNKDGRANTFREENEINKENIRNRSSKTKKIDREDLGKNSKEDFLYGLAEKPKMLAAYTPRGLKKVLENQGYEVKTLKSGNHKNITFEEGGGYKVNFGKDGILMYHPEEASHHKGAYFKISTGKTGVKRYKLNGDELYD